MPFEHAPKSDHHFFWKFSSPHHSIIFICLDTIILNVVHTINVKKLFVEKENSHSLLLIEIRLNQISESFYLSFMRIGEERFDYYLVWRVPKIMFFEYLYERFLAPSKVFELKVFFFPSFGFSLSQWWTTLARCMKSLSDDRY